MLTYLTRGLAYAMLVLGLGVLANESHAIALPPSCATNTWKDPTTPLEDAAQAGRTRHGNDPAAAFALLCALTIPRVEREKGADSVELAWRDSLATPLIAYMDKYDEALPPLEFSRPIFERRYGRYGEPLGDIHVAYAWIYMRQGKLTDCEAAWAEALRCESEPSLKKVELQKVLVGLLRCSFLRDFAASSGTRTGPAIGGKRRSDQRGRRGDRSC